jgi:hypothetical protein
VSPEYEENLRSFIVDLANSTEGIAATIHKAERELGNLQTDWECDSLNEKSQAAIRRIDEADEQELANHINAIADDLLKAKQMLEAYKSNTDRRVGEGGMLGKFISSSLNRIDSLLEQKRNVLRS